MKEKPIYKVPVPLELYLWRAALVALPVYLWWQELDIMFVAFAALIALASFRRSPDCRVEVFEDRIVLTYPGIQQKVNTFYYDRMSGYVYSAAEGGLSFRTTSNLIRLLMPNPRYSQRPDGPRIAFDYVKDDGSQKLIIRDFALNQNDGIVKVNELIKQKIKK